MAGEVEGLGGISGGAVGIGRNPDLTTSFSSEDFFTKMEYPLYLAKNHKK
jgi:hypothetical protein